jgi:prephenate dehydratase
MKNPVSLLAPLGTTFSHAAYMTFMQRFGAPFVDASNFVKADSNSAILGLVQEHGGFGVIAMETLAELRVTESVDSFVALLKRYRSPAECPFTIAAGVRKTLSFALMVHPQGDHTQKNLIAHPKSLGACAKWIEKEGYVTTSLSEGNGRAAELVASSTEYRNYAVVGPRMAADTLGLEVFDEDIEDEPAKTTFFMLAPKTHPQFHGSAFRVLVVFKFPKNKPGLIHVSTGPFARYNIDLIQIYNTSGSRDGYHFLYEMVAPASQLGDLEAALGEFLPMVSDHLVFGPFPVIDE